MEPQVMDGLYEVRIWETEDAINPVGVVYTHFLDEVYDVIEDYQDRSFMFEVIVRT